MGGRGQGGHNLPPAFGGGGGGGCGNKNILFHVLVVLFPYANGACNATVLHVVSIAIFHKQQPPPTAIQTINNICITIAITFTIAAQIHRIVARFGDSIFDRRNRGGANFKRSALLPKQHHQGAHLTWFRIWQSSPTHTNENADRQNHVRRHDDMCLSIDEDEGEDQIGTATANHCTCCEIARNLGC